MFAAISEKVRLAAEIGPVRYVAVLIVGSSTDLEAACYNLVDLDDIGGGPPRADRDADLRQVVGCS
jgi:hypothetical protein